jgi:mRNA-degrading endonuclease toxin of MazEF toxin-antitoxin module
MVLKGMRRGEISIVAGGKDYAGKPRPVVILQDDRFDATGSITICAFTADETDAPLFRLPVHPNERDMPYGGGQDDHRAKDEGWRPRRPAGRRG